MDGLTSTNLTTKCLSYSSTAGCAHFGRTVQRCSDDFFGSSTAAKGKAISGSSFVAQSKIISHALDANKISASCLEPEVCFSNDYYDKNGLLMIKNLTFPELRSWCVSIGEDEKRAMQLWRWMYRDMLWLRHIDEAPASVVQNGFSDAFRKKFNDIATLDGGLELQEEYLASDGTRKLVFRVHSGPAAGGKIETVLIPIVRERGKKDRITLCVSSQVGCAMGCKFCYTGKMGLLGNLTPAQIIEQVVSARRFQFEQTCLGSLQLEGHDSLAMANNKFTTTINNIVFMGMGEPLHNMPGILPAIDTLLDHHGLHFSHNKVTVSTVGLIPEMKILLKSCRASLAVSLHGATDAVRSSIVPVNLRYPVEELVSVLREEFPIEARGGAHVLIEYTMMSQVNDSIEDAKALLSLLKGVKCKINLIVFNPHEGTEYRASTQEAVVAFRDILIKGGRVATVRCSRGEESMAACGQLGEGKRVMPI